MDELEKLYGIGPVYANKIIREGVNGVKIDTSKPIRRQLKSPKIYPHLPLATQADLKYNPSRKIPRIVIADIAKTLKHKLKGTKHEIAGSFRRKKPFSRDIDLIISTKTTNMDRYLKKINVGNRKFKIVHIFAQGDDKVSAIITYKGPASKNKKINIKADIFFTDPREYMFMLLFATGSGKFNIRMRSVAKRKGYLLNHHGLYKRAAPDSNILDIIPIKTEKELFKYLKIHYLPPELRN